MIEESKIKKYPTIVTTNALLMELYVFPIDTQEIVSETRHRKAPVNMKIPPKKYRKAAKKNII